MLNARRAQVAFVLVAAFAIAGCDSTQPDRIETRSASLSFQAQALVNIWDCYELPFPRCFQVFNSGTTVPLRETRKVPWNYSLRITVIRAGEAQEELVTSTTGVLGSSLEPGDLIEDFISLTNYDPDMPTVPDRIEGSTTYTNGHRVSSGSPIYLSTIFVDFGIPNMLEVFPDPLDATPTFDFVLNTGDTVVVRARKQLVGLSPSVSPPFEQLALTGQLALSGVEVPTLGTSESPTSDGAGFTFSFTVQ